MKFLLTFSDEQTQGLDTLMRDDLQTNRTAYVAGLIGAELKRRAEAREAVKNKKPVGRPRKDADESEYEETPDYSHDMPKDIPHFGRMIGKRELQDIENAQRDFQPKA